MKHTRLSKRIFCLLLVMVLVLSVFAGLTLTAFAANEITIAKNSQPRGTVCTALSSRAVSYYNKSTDNGKYTYATVSALGGVNNAESSYLAAQNNPIYTRLQTLMTSTHTNTNVNYSGYTDNTLASYWMYTDAQNGGTGFCCFYSDKAYNSMTSSGDFSMDREHIWPSSKADFYQDAGTGGTDLHHMRPSERTVNQTYKSDYTFANIRGNYSTYSTGTVDGTACCWYIAGSNGTGLFETKDSVKGDVARILLYVYVRWSEPNLYAATSTRGSGASTGVKVIESRDTLLEWCRLDPVDTWEMERNDLVQQVQGNRNVFIDYPEYAWLMFGLTPPADMQTPSGMAQNSGLTVTATSNNNSYGTVSVSGYTITASPAEGYYAAGYTVTSGTATVTQHGNVFSVTPSTNCTVRINFAAKTAYTVTYRANGTVTTATVYSGEDFTLPNTAASGGDDWTFVGWTKDSGYQESTTRPTSYYAKGATTSVTENTTFYAVYAQGAGGGSDTFIKYTDAAMTAGDYLIVSDGGAMNNTTTSNRLGVTNVTISDDSVSSPGAAIIWHIAPSGSYWTIYSENNSQYAVSTTTKNQLTTAASADRGLWTITNSADGAVIQNKARAEGSSDTGNAYIRRNGTYGFACYGTSTGTGPVLYKKSGVSTYTITPVSCAHSNLTAHPANAASCTEPGNSAYWSCDDCGKFFSDAGAETQIEENSWVIPAAGHSFQVYGYDENGHWSVCGACGQSYDNEAHSFTATVTKEATYTETGIRTYTCTCGYSYTEEIPMLTYTGESGTVYKLAGEIKDGDKVVIVNAKSSKALSSADLGTGNKIYYRAAVDVTPANNEITDPDDAIVWEVEYDSTNGYSFKYGNDYLSVPSNANQLTLSASERYWNVNFISGANTASIVSTTSIYSKNGDHYRAVEYYSTYNEFTAYASTTDNYSGNEYQMSFYVLQQPEAEVKGVSLTVGGDINANAYLAVPAALVNSELTATLTYTDQNGDTVLVSSGKIADMTPQNNGLYKFTAQMPAREILTKIQLVLTDENGDPVSFLNPNGTTTQEYEFCVQDYLDQVIGNANSYPDKLVNLCKSMSDYGSYAMVQQNYHADDAKAIHFGDEINGITTDTAGLQGLAGSVSIPDQSDIAGLRFYGASLVMKSEMAIRFYFKYTGSGTLTYDNGKALTANGSYLYAEVSDIAARDFAVGRSVTISDGNGHTFTVGGYSVHTYIRQQLQKAKDGTPVEENLLNLVRAIALYGFKAEAYFA